MHDRLLQRLLSIATVRLISSLRDERLAFSDPKDLRVFVPDIHLISKRRFKQGNFRYATNYTDLLEEVAIELRKLRSSLAADERLTIYQVGDFLDLWRESPGTDGDVSGADRIEDDHEDLVAALTHPKLQTHFLLGNHDLQLYQRAAFSAWERRYFIPDHTNDPPTAILVHGDVFDWVEKFGPDALQEIIVFLFSPYAPASVYKLGKMGDFVKGSHGRKQYRDAIQLPTAAPVGQLRNANGGTIPARWNVQKKGEAPPENLKFLDSAYNLSKSANLKYGLKLTTCVIGHTHHARIATLDDANGEFFCLIDCGAWIEDFVGDGDDTPAPNAQIAALCGNEARIYQLAP